MHTSKKTHNNAFILSPFSEILVVQDNLNKSAREQFGFHFKEQVLLQSYKFRFKNTTAMIKWHLKLLYKLLHSATVFKVFCCFYCTFSAEMF
jgi:hypothetical protein